MGQTQGKSSKKLAKNEMKRLKKLAKKEAKRQKKQKKLSKNASAGFNGSFESENGGFGTDIQLDGENVKSEHNHGWCLEGYSEEDFRAERKTDYTDVKKEMFKEESLQSLRPGNLAEEYNEVEIENFKGDGYLYEPEDTLRISELDTPPPPSPFNCRNLPELQTEQPQSDVESIEVETYVLEQYQVAENCERNSMEKLVSVCWEKEADLECSLETEDTLEQHNSSKVHLQRETSEYSLVVDPNVEISEESVMKEFDKVLEDSHDCKLECTNNEAVEEKQHRNKTITTEKLPQEKKYNKTWFDDSQHLQNCNNTVQNDSNYSSVGEKTENEMKTIDSNKDSFEDNTEEKIFSFDANASENDRKNMLDNDEIDRKEFVKSRGSFRVGEVRNFDKETDVEKISDDSSGGSMSFTDKFSNENDSRKTNKTEITATIAVEHSDKMRCKSIDKFENSKKTDSQMANKMKKAESAGKISAMQTKKNKDTDVFKKLATDSNCKPPKYGHDKTYKNIQYNSSTRKPQNNKTKTVKDRMNFRKEKQMKVKDSMSEEEHVKDRKQKMKRELAKAR